MNIVTLELVRTALLALIAGVLIAAGRLRIDLGGRGWRIIFCGFVIVLAASAFDLAEHFEQLRFQAGPDGPSTNGIMMLIGFLVGFSLIGMEMIRAVANAQAARRTRKVTDALGKVKTQLSSGQALLRGVLKSSLSGVVVVRAVRDEAGVVVDLVVELMNAAAVQILGRTTDELIGQRLLPHVPALNNEGLFNECVSVIESGLPFNEERRYAFAGSAEWLHTVVVKLGDGCAITFTNISARKQAEEQLRRAALHDGLTGLPNRVMFLQRLELALHWARRHSSYSFAVLFFDFDRFKAVNDNLGHEAGDQLLISIADRLRTELGFDETLSRENGHLPARLGGDEFVVILDGVKGVSDAVRVAQRLQDAMAEPHPIAGQQVVSTASIGIVFCDGDYERSDDILRDADSAMYEAKRAGRSCHVVFDARVHGRDTERPRERAA